MKHLHNLLSGFLVIGDAFGRPRSYNLGTDGFAVDARNLAGDSRRVAAGMIYIIKSNQGRLHGKTDASEGSERSWPEFAGFSTRNR